MSGPEWFEVLPGSTGSVIGQTSSTWSRIEMCSVPKYHTMEASISFMDAKLFNWQAGILLPSVWIKNWIKLKNDEDKKIALMGCLYPPGKLLKNLQVEKNQYKWTCIKMKMLRTSNKTELFFRIIIIWKILMTTGNTRDRDLKLLWITVTY